MHYISCRARDSFKFSERKRDYSSAVTKRKSKQKKEEVIKKLPKISTFLLRFYE